MKNLFSLKTISIYAVGCLFIAMSIYGLGSANLMVGGFGVFLLKAIVNKDFSTKPLTSIMNICIYTLAIAILPYIVNLNLYTGLIINFISIFLILYMLVYSLKETIYVPFLLGYAFFLTDSATGHSFKLRIIGLIIIAVASVIFQIILYKIQGVNVSLNNICKSLTLLDDLIECKIHDNNNFDATKAKLEKHNLSWNQDILNHKQNEFYLNKIETVQVNLLSAIRSLKVKIEKFDENNSELNLNDLRDILAKIRDFSKGKYKRYHLIEDFSYFNTKYKNHSNDTTLYEIKESLNVIFVLSLNFYDMEHGTIKVSRRTKLRDYIELEKNLFKDFRRGSSRFTFSFRTALLISLTYFFVSLFHLEHGKWAVYTIVSISQPYYDITKQKALQRLKGTVIGGLIFTLLNFVFVTFDLRLLCIFISIYFIVYLADYSKRIIATTVMALMIVSISESSMFLITLDRFFFVMIGVIIVIIGSILILPYKVETEIYDLTILYYNSCQDVINSFLKVHDNFELLQEIDNKILEATSMETKIKVKNSAYDMKILDDFLSDGRFILDTIQKILNRVFYYDQSLLENKTERISNLTQMKKDIDNLSDSDFENYSIENIIKKYTNPNQSQSELLIYKDVYDVLLANRRLMYIKKSIDNLKKDLN